MDSKAGQALKYQIYQKVKQLNQQRHEISVYWIPGHSNVKRNERANMAAKKQLKAKGFKQHNGPIEPISKSKSVKKRTHSYQCGTTKEQKSEKVKKAVFIFFLKK